MFIFSLLFQYVSRILSELLGFKGRSRFEMGTMTSLEGKLLLLPTVALMMHYQMPQISKFLCYLCVLGFIKKIRGKSTVKTQVKKKFRSRSRFFFVYAELFTLKIQINPLFTSLICTNPQLSPRLACYIFQARGSCLLTKFRFL